MAVLSDADRLDAARKMIRKVFVEAGATADLDTTEIKTLIADLDAYLDANATAINQAITAAVRTKASLSQKAMALAYAAMKRGGVI